MADQIPRERKRRQDSGEPTEQTKAAASVPGARSSASVTAWYLALAGYAVLILSFAAILIAVLADRSRQSGKPTPGGKHAVFSREEANPTNWELLNDCPGGRNQNADRCTFENFQKTSIVYGYRLSNVVGNCGSGAVAAVLRQMHISPPTGPQYSLWKKAQVGGTPGDSAPEGIQIDHEWIEQRKHSHERHPVTMKEQHAVSPATKAAVLVQQKYVRHVGRVRVNYGHKLARHYVWYVEDFNIDVPQGPPSEELRTWACHANPEAELIKFNADFTKAQIS